MLLLAFLAGRRRCCWWPPWSGSADFYNVAASDSIAAGHLADRARRAARREHYHRLAVEDPPTSRTRIGKSWARGTELQCASCHGSPAAPPAELARHMLPVPPDLATTIDRWSDKELFWIVQHGLEFTAMPSWSTQEQGDVSLVDGRLPAHIARAGCGALPGHGRRG